MRNIMYDLKVVLPQKCKIELATSKVPAAPATGNL